MEANINCKIIATVTDAGIDLRTIQPQIKETNLLQLELLLERYSSNQQESLKNEILRRAFVSKQTVVTLCRSIRVQPQDVFLQLLQEIIISSISTLRDESAAVIAKTVAVDNIKLSLDVLDFSELDLDCGEIINQYNNAGSSKEVSLRNTLYGLLLKINDKYPGQKGTIKETLNSFLNTSRVSAEHRRSVEELREDLDRTPEERRTARQHTKGWRQRIWSAPMKAWIGCVGVFVSLAGLSFAVWNHFSGSEP
jgi:hypothetical protein